MPVSQIPKLESFGFGCVENKGSRQLTIYCTSWRGTYIVQGTGYILISNLHFSMSYGLGLVCVRYEEAYKDRPGLFSSVGIVNRKSQILGHQHFPVSHVPSHIFTEV